MATRRSTSSAFKGARTETRIDARRRRRHDREPMKAGTHAPGDPTAQWVLSAILPTLRIPPLSRHHSLDSRSIYPARASAPETALVFLLLVRRFAAFDRVCSTLSELVCHLMCSEAALPHSRLVRGRERRKEGQRILAAALQSKLEPGSKVYRASAFCRKGSRLPTESRPPSNSSRSRPRSRHRR